MIEIKNHPRLLEHNLFCSPFDLFGILLAKYIKEKKAKKVLNS